MSCLLPDSRKLKHIRHVCEHTPCVFDCVPLTSLLSLQQPLHLLVSGQGNPSLRLLLWYYEDQLKVKYTQFLTTLKVCFFDFEKGNHEFFVFSNFFMTQWLISERRYSVGRKIFVIVIDFFLQGLTWFRKQML